MANTSLRLLHLPNVSIDNAPFSEYFLIECHLGNVLRASSGERITGHLANASFDNEGATCLANISFL